MKKILSSLNVFEQCRELEVEPLSCPRFLFVLMGLIIITSILITYSVGQRYATPDMVIGLVSGLTIVLLIIMHVIVQAFEQVVLARRKEIAHAKEVLLLRDEFVYMAIHDLRSGGTAIKWGLKLLEDADKASPKDSKEIITQMRQKNERLLKLARNILLVTRIDGGTLDVRQEEVPLRAAIDDALSDEKETIAEHRVRVEVDLPARLPALLADPVHTRELLGLLINNAVEHADETSPHCAITATEQSGELFLIVENNGPAIPPDAIGHVFEQYWRASGPDRHEGSGLPLYIAHELARLMGGRMWFSSSPNRTSFTVALPTK